MPVVTAPPPIVVTAPAPVSPGRGDPMRNGQTHLTQIRWTPPPLDQSPPLVAVLDTGVDATSPDLDGLFQEAPRTFAPGGGSPTVDSATHGTQVVGIISALTDNGIGISGISRSPILAVKVADAGGRAETSSLVRGIRYAIARRAQILNISFEGGGLSQVEQDAINDAVRSGAVVVVASGNSGRRRIEYPGAYRHVISVAAVDETNRRLSTSTSGPQVTLAAPGGNVLSTLPGGQYGQASGTSFAAAVVSGVAARVWAARPDLTASQVIDILERSARDVGPSGRDDDTGAGVVDLTSALAQAHEAPDTREPNDDPRTAARLPIALPATRTSATIAGTVGGWRDPADGYRVALTAGQTFSAQLVGPAQADMDLRLWRPRTPTLRRNRAFARTWLAASSFGPQAQERLSFTPTTSGIYTIVIDASRGAGAYRLVLGRGTPTGTEVTVP